MAIKQIIINESIKLMEDIKTKEIPENKNPKKYSVLLKKCFFYEKKG